MISGIADKTVKHDLYLPFGSMGPNRVGEEEIKFLSEHRRIEVWVGVKARRLTLQDFRLQDAADAGFKPPFVRFDSAIAAGVEEVREPVTGAQDPAADIEHFGIRIESLIQQVGELLASGKLEITDRNTIKLVSGQRFEFLL